MLREKYKDIERKGWLVVGSDSWIKGTQAAAEWCEKNQIELIVLKYSDTEDKWREQIERR